MAWLAMVWVMNLLGAGFGPIGSRPLLAYSVAFLLLGGQVMSLGFVAELLVSYTGRDVDTYSVSERTKPRSHTQESVIV